MAVGGATAGDATSPAAGAGGAAGDAAVCGALGDIPSDGYGSHNVLWMSISKCEAKRTADDQGFDSSRFKLSLGFVRQSRYYQIQKKELRTVTSPKLRRLLQCLRGPAVRRWGRDLAELLSSVAAHPPLTPRSLCPWVPWFGYAPGAPTTEQQLACEIRSLDRLRYRSRCSRAC